MVKIVDEFVLPDGGIGGGSGAHKPQMNEEFVTNPERFRPTARALYMAYVTALGETQDLHKANAAGCRKIVEDSIASGELKSVFVEANGADFPGQSYNVIAVKGGKEDSCHRVIKPCDGIELSELVERIPEPE